MIGNLLLAIGLTIGVGTGGVSNSHYLDIPVFQSSTQLRNVTGINFNQNFNFYYNDFFTPEFGNYFYCRDEQGNWHTRSYTEDWYTLDAFMENNGGIFGFNTYCYGNVLRFNPCWRTFSFNINGSPQLNNGFFFGFEINNDGFGTTAKLQYKNKVVKSYVFDVDNEYYSFWYLDYSCIMNFYDGETSSNGVGCLLGLDYTITFTGLSEYVQDENQWNIGFGAFVPSVEQNPYDLGYGNGYKDGQMEGASTAYHNGYIDGQNAGMQISQTSFMSLFASLVDTPMRMLYSLFNFDLFGTSMLIIILSTLTAIVVIKILKKFI